MMKNLLVMFLYLQQTGTAAVPRAPNREYYHKRRFSSERSSLAAVVYSPE
jgi:hypothetical protein